MLVSGKDHLFPYGADEQHTYAVSFAPGRNGVHRMEENDQNQSPNENPNPNEDPNEIRNKFLFFAVAIVFLIIFKYAFGY